MAKLNSEQYQSLIADEIDYNKKEEIIKKADQNLSNSE